MRLIGATALVALAACFATGIGVAAPTSGGATAWPRGTVVVTYASERALRAALADLPARVVRRLPRLRVAELHPAGDVDRFAVALEELPGIVDVSARADRRSQAEPALVRAPATGAPQWQFAATRSDLVPGEVLRAAASVTIAVVDTGADLSAPDLAAKAPLSHSVRTRGSEVTDRNGHGTFVASLAAGSVTNGEGIAGSGGDARLIVVQAAGSDGAFSDVEEAAGIVWAVDHGARIINLSLGGPETSVVERRAVEYAIGKGALLVAAVGNAYHEGNRVEYPAALLQPRGSKGVGGSGLAVAASNRDGERAFFSNTGTHLSLAAPGESVFGAVSASASPTRFPRVPLPGSLAGAYGYGSGTSYAAPQVAGAAALVWAANPSLDAAGVAAILEETATGGGVWNPQLGFGILDVAAAVARAQGATGSGIRVQGRRAGRRITLSWPGLVSAAAFRVSVEQDSRPQQVLTPATTATSVSYSLAPGSVYRFTVAALDGSGVPTTVSAPWSVSLRQARASLELAARARGSRTTELNAWLRVSGGDASSTSRRLILESFAGGRWSRVGAALTDGEGLARWQFSSQRRPYEFRARYAGSDDLAAVVSRTVTVSTG